MLRESAMKKTRLLMAIICCMSFMALVANLTACVAEKPAPQPVATVLKSRIPAFEVSAPTAGAEIADSNFGINFKFELGGVLEPLTSYSGGGVTFEMKEATEGNNPTNTPTNLNSFIVGVEWENFIIERNYSNDKKNWREWWAKIKNGDVEYKNFTLTYLDKKGNPTGRSLKGFNACPIR